MDGLTTGWINAAKNIQKPISLAAVALLVLYLVFSKIIAPIKEVDQTILPLIVSWIGTITLVTVVMAISAYVLPLFVRSRAGELAVDAPIVTKPTGTPRHRTSPSSGITTKAENTTTEPPQKGFEG